METIRIHCTNDGRYHDVQPGMTLAELSARICTSLPDTDAGRDNCSTEHPTVPVLAALVDNQLKELGFRIMMPHEIEFIGYNHPDGRRTYIRSLCFVLQKAIRDLFPDHTLVIDYSLPSGLYCEIRERDKTSGGSAEPQAKTEDGRPVIHPTETADLMAIRASMQEIISRHIPLTKRKLTSEEAIRIFEENGQPVKARLVESLGKYTFSVYFLGHSGRASVPGEPVPDTGDRPEPTLGNRHDTALADTFYGPLVPSTGYLTSFAISGFKDGFCLQYPMEGSTSKIEPMKKQSKIAATLKKHSDWCSIIGVKGIGTLNRVIQDGKAIQLINLAEARHERDYAEIADKIWQQREKSRIVFIAGPSSSGKTSSSLRLAIQCKVLGLNPKVIELDNYFVDRDKTPLDENGEYDFESLKAMDLDYLNAQLNDLLSGKEVEIPKYSFKAGRREETGTPLKLEEKDILIMEGIHALNPEMTPAVDDSRIFRVYASALTSLSIDENNNISTSDNRLLRRMVRDNRVRGITPEETILRWHSVRRGENRNIFPFQENADAEFNSALIFELPMLKYYAEPLLRRISPASPAFAEATRLLKFLEYIVALSPDEIAAIPPTSIMREFIGGQTL